MIVTRSQSGKDSVYSVICMIVTRSQSGKILLYSVICMIVTRSQSGKDSALFCYMYDCNP